MNVYEVLKELNIHYTEVTHEAVYTIEEANEKVPAIAGVGCKNLFLTDHKGKYFLVFMEENNRADLKSLAKFLKVSRLSFAKEEDVESILGLISGGLTPLGIINDSTNKVVLVLDKTLENSNVLCHPNTNTNTISLSFSDLIKFIEYEKHTYIYFNDNN